MFLLFYFEHPTLNGTVRPHDNARPHAARNTTQFLANNIVQSSPLGLPCPQTLTQTNTLGTSWRDVLEAE